MRESKAGFSLGGVRALACASSIAATALLLVLAAGAEAVTYHGHTVRHKRVVLHVNSRGLIQRGKISWKANCSGEGYFRTTTFFVKPFSGRRAGAFSDHGSYVIRSRGGYRSRVKTRASGHQVSERLWKGHFRASAKVMRHGHFVARCILRREGWKATTATGRVTLNSDPGDFIGAGGVYHYHAPPDHITGGGNQSSLEFTAGPWIMQFGAPAGRHFHSHTTYRHARRAAFAGSHAGLDVYGDGRGCNDVTGSFRVKKVRFTRHATLRFIRLTFVMHCEGEKPALHGRVTFHAG